jgi:hypothetical protein
LVRDVVAVDASPVHPTPPAGVRVSRSILSAVTDSAVDAPAAHDLTKEEARARVELNLARRGMTDEKVSQWLLLNLEQR